MKLVDLLDSKSCGSNPVPVRFRPEAPFTTVLEPTRWIGTNGISFLYFSLKFKFSFPGDEIPSVPVAL